MKVLVAGATGAIGLPLARALREHNHQVVGTTRRVERVSALTSIGVEAEVVDVYDLSALKVILHRHLPQVVIHQLTDLPFGLPSAEMNEGRRRNERLRLQGTQNLVEAMQGLPVQRFIVQSIAFAYADGPTPHGEDDQLASSVLAQFEQCVLSSGFDSTVLRYGRFYGPRTGVAHLEVPCRVHIHAAADATLRALGPMQHGVYNVCEDNVYAESTRFIEETSWSPLAHAM